MQAKKPGDEVELRVYAGGQTRTVRVKTVRTGDLPGRRGGATFYFGDGMGSFMETMPLRAPIAPRVPFSHQFDEDLSLRDLDDLHIEIDGSRIARELERIGPEIRERMRDLGPEIRFNVERAMREAERGLGAGLDGMSRALEELDLRIGVDVDRAPRLRDRRSETTRVPTTKVVTSF